MDILKAKEIIVDFIREKRKEAGIKGAVIGLSGGIDSALTAYLTVEALGEENVLGIHMPELNLTPAEDVLDATEVAHRLGIDLTTVDISEILAEYINSVNEKSFSETDSYKHAQANLKARIRMSILYYHANMMSRIVIGTGNKTEILLGYFTKYGDGGVDIEPIGDLYKTEVTQMAHLIGIPEEILKKAPSARLWVGQTDEDELGIKYELLDRFLALLLEGERPHVAQNTLGLTGKQRESLIKRINANLHKQKTPPIADLDTIR